MDGFFDIALQILVVAVLIGLAGVALQTVWRLARFVAGAGPSSQDDRKSVEHSAP